MIQFVNIRRSKFTFVHSVQPKAAVISPCFVPSVEKCTSLRDSIISTFAEVVFTGCYSQKPKLSLLHLLLKVNLESNIVWRSALETVWVI